jgi:gliding motility-associated-like protein
VGGIDYQWSLGGNDEVIGIDTTSVIWLEAFNACGVERDTMRITFNGQIRTALGEDTVLCDVDSIQLFGSDPGASYVWNTGETTDTILTEVGRSRTYIVTVTLGECQSIASRRITSNDTACADIDCSLRYGNVFTPNGDGINDLFRIDSDCDVFKFDLLIYNRWGQVVHHSSHIAYGWDGYINGEPAAAGTYFFTVRYKDFVVVNADRFLNQGSFSLLR